MSTNISTRNETCIAAATAVIGDKWTPKIIRALELPQRFCHLQSLAGGINPRTLSARLTELEKSKIITKKPIKNSAHFEYTLTLKGKDLLPILDAMTAWGNKYPKN